MPNVLISELDASGTLASGDMFLVQHAAGPPAEFCTAAQIAAYAFASTVVLTGQTTATTVGVAGAGPALPATPEGLLQISINGTAYKIPYYLV